MKLNRLSGTFSCALLASQWLTGLSADFVLVPEQSTITLSGSAVGAALLEQAPGSLSNRFQGVIRADVTASTIAFPGGSVIAAQTNGNWQPLADGSSGSAPGNYGAQASVLLGTAKAAVRNLQLDAACSALPLNGTSFDSSPLVFGFITAANGTLGYTVSGLFATKGGVALTGYATNKVTTMATLIKSGDVETLTIPVKADFYFTLVTQNDCTLTVTGKLVGTRSTGGSTTPTYNDWAATQFPGVTDPAIIGSSADPDHDGFPNFVEYALGLDPKSSNAGLQVVAADVPATGQKPQLVYTRAKGLSGNTVNYVFRSFPDQQVIPGTEQVVDLGNGKEQVTLQPTFDSATGPHLMRLTVSPK